MSGKVRHILALSGGKDSSAFAVFMKDKVPCSLLADVGEYLYLLHVVHSKKALVSVTKGKKGYITKVLSAQ